MEPFEVAGARFVVSGDVLEDLPAEPRNLLVTATPASPRLELLIGANLRVTGRVITQEPGFDTPLHQFMIGTDYLEPVFETLGRLLNAGPISSEETMERGGLTFTVTTGRPRLDGRTTDTIQTTISRDVESQLETVVRTLVDVAQRRFADIQFLRGRSYEVTRKLPTSPMVVGVRLADVGGLDDVVRELRDVADSFKHPEVMARWGAQRPQGILMWGPPGTGKTTLAKALATEIGGVLREIRTPDILDQWMGASERNIKRIFTEARGYTEPTVLLFDEFDSIISYAGAPRGSADQAINSVAGIFKQEMNTLIEDNPLVIVVATTNFPQRVDDSLIRSGRFDVKIAVPLPSAAARADILRKMIGALVERHFAMFAADVSIEELAERAVGLSGADLREVLRRAQLAKAMAEARGQEAGPITQAELLATIAALVRRTA